jgi:hypothetical protein
LGSISGLAVCSEICLISERMVTGKHGQCPWRWCFRMHV